MSLFAILCSGQGAQSPDLFAQFPFTDKGFALKQRILEAGCLEAEVAAWLAHPTAAPDAIYQNHYSQPLLCLFQAMIWAELEDGLPLPGLIAGYSLGELSAYGCAGAITTEDVLRLAGMRARAMDTAAATGELLAVTGLSIEAATAAATPAGGYVAIVIGDDHCVLGCLATQAIAVMDAMRAAGAREVIPLHVSVASHTPLLDAAVEPFRKALQTAAWSTPRMPILAGINSAKVLRREQMELWLPEQIHHAIRWDRIQQRMRESNCHVFLELGPGRQLAHMAAGAGVEARSVEEFRSIDGILAWVAKALDRAS